MHKLYKMMNKSQNPPFNNPNSGSGSTFNWPNNASKNVAQPQQQQQQTQGPFGVPAQQQPSFSPFGTQQQQTIQNPFGNVFAQPQPSQAQPQPLFGQQPQPQQQQQQWTGFGTPNTAQAPAANTGLGSWQPFGQQNQVSQVQGQPQQTQPQPGTGFQFPSNQQPQNQNFFGTPQPQPQQLQQPFGSFGAPNPNPVGNQIQFQYPQQQQQQQFGFGSPTPAVVAPYGGFGSTPPPFTGNTYSGQGPMFAQGRGLDWKYNWPGANANTTTARVNTNTNMPSWSGPNGHGRDGPRGFTERDFIGNDSVSSHLRSVLQKMEPRGDRFNQIKQHVTDPNLLRWNQPPPTQMSPMPSGLTMRSSGLATNPRTHARAKDSKPPGFNQILGPLSEEACDEWLNRIDQVDSHRPAYLWSDRKDSMTSVYGNALQSLRAHDAQREAAMQKRDNFYNLFPTLSAQRSEPSRRPHTASATPAGWTQLHPKTVFPLLEAERRRDRHEKESRRSLMNFRTRCNSNQFDSWEEAIRKKAAAAATFKLPPAPKEKPGPPLLNGPPSWSDLIRSRQYRAGASYTEVGSIFESSLFSSRRPPANAKVGADIQEPGVRSQSSEELCSVLRGVKRESKRHHPPGKSSAEHFQDEFDELQLQPPAARRPSLENLPSQVFDMSYEQDEVIANTSTYTKQTPRPRAPFDHAGTATGHSQIAPNSTAASATATAGGSGVSTSTGARVLYPLPQFTISSRYRNRTGAGRTTGAILHEGHSQEDSIHTILSPRLVTAAASEDAEIESLIRTPPSSSSRKSRSKRSQLKDKPKSGYRSGVVLTNPEYFCTPIIDELDERVDDNGNCFVDDFKIGHVEWGNVVFPGRMNVAGLNIDETVKFGHGGLTIHPTSPSQVSPGRGVDLLSRPAIITYEKFERDTNVPIGKFLEHLHNQCQDMGGELINYDVENEQLTFKITRSKCQAPSSLPSTSSATATSTLTGHSAAVAAAASI